MSSYNYSSPNVSSYNYSYPGTTNTTCSTGNLVNGQCVTNIEGQHVTQTTCSSGVLTNGQCINTVNGTVVTQIVCPSGVLTNGQCVNTITGTIVNSTFCPAGTTVSGTNCISNVNGTVVTRINCPSGTTLTNGQCINTVNGTVVTQIVCPSGVLTNGQCVNTITGTIVNSTFCPAGTTVSGTNCISNVNGTVVTRINCPSGTTLTNGQCINTVNGTVVTQIVCPSGSTLTNGQCVNTVTGTVVTTTVCPVGTTLSGTNCLNTINGTVVTTIVCPSGSTLTNGQCVNTITGTIVTNIVCPAGAVLTNSQCVNTITGTIITNVQCPSGYVLTGNQCVSTITPPLTTITNCPTNTQYINGVCQQTINPRIVVTQTCWDGSVIPATSVCQAQYKVCANGTSVPVSQNCFVTSTQVYTHPEVVTFNNVVTSVVTQITNISGRCNGIGLVANGAPSTGWFEYGETANLGRTTASAQIGSSTNAPFSNVLASLKPNTKYFCRAVMQNQYGLVKGEIVSFVTKTTAVKYVKPVIVTKMQTRSPVKKNEIVCSDGSTVTVKSESTASLINQGQKLLAVQIEKVDGKLSSGEIVHYKVNYKNLADSRLTGVVVKVTLPQEVMVTNATSGNYDEQSRTLTLNQDLIDPYTEGTILITGTVVHNAPIGKTIVTNVYAVYTVPGTKTQDEVTAYVIGSIVPTIDSINKDTGVKKVVGISDGKGFMPNSLIEWLALLAILFIIFILGRSIYASYKDDEATKHH